jgi:hypothetical protein
MGLFGYWLEDLVVRDDPVSDSREKAQGRMNGLLEEGAPVSENS